MDLVTSSPAIGPDGTVYVGSHDGMLYAFDGMNGSVKWTFQTNDDIRFNSPTLSADATVYIGSYDGALYALDSNDGSLRWQFSTGGVISGSSAAIGWDGTVYFGSHDKSLYALDGRSGPANAPWAMYGQNSKRTGNQQGTYLKLSLWSRKRRQRPVYDPRGEIDNPKHTRL